MKTKKDFLTNYSNHPELAKKVLNQMTVSWNEIAVCPDDYRNAAHGVSGFIYYSETVKFAKRNLVLIMRALNEYERECGQLDKPTDDDTQYFNWLAWFALENTIQEITYYLEA
jgi:hypothetical protein